MAGDRNEDEALLAVTVRLVIPRPASSSPQSSVSFVAVGVLLFGPTCALTGVTGGGSLELPVLVGVWWMHTVKEIANYLRRAHPDHPATAPSAASAIPPTSSANSVSMAGKNPYLN